MKNVLLIVLIFLATFVPLMFLTSTLTQAAPADEDGKQLFMDNKCVMCHSVPAAGIETTAKSEKMKGPDLPGAQADAEFLVKYLMKKENLDGNPHKVPFKGSEAELNTLVGWLLQQK